MYLIIIEIWTYYQLLLKSTITNLTLTFLQFYFKTVPYLCLLIYKQYTMIKKSSILYILLLFVTVTALNAQTSDIDDAFKKSSIDQLNQLSNDFYVFPEVAKKTEKHLNQLLKSGHFDEFTDVEAFAKALTEAVQSINEDKHMRIRARPQGKTPDNTVDRMFEDHLRRKKRVRESVAGLRAVKKLDGNVGYIDLRGFVNVGAGAPAADNYMNFLSTSDAIIIDLRKNGGGDPGMVQYLCSYFFDKKVHLNSLYWREGNQTNEFWTLDEVNGKKLPNVSLFILTSPHTFSAAEEFSYNMQTQKRATLVGETTGGGANPGGTRPINERLSVFIPTGKAINPITGTNWEGVGVVPEVKTTADEAFNKGYELAKIAAEKYREKKNEKYKAIVEKLKTNLSELSNEHTDDEIKKYKKVIYHKLKLGTEMGLFSEGEINFLGYNYLNEFNSPKQAEVIFESNTKLFPNSANVYDSYGEVLAMNGKLKAAIENYEKAVKVGSENNDPQLNLYKENLQKVKGK